MSHARQIEPAIDVEAFDAFLGGRDGEERWELVDGCIVAMSNPSERHERIASNLGARLTLAMDDRGCHTYQGGMGVQVSDDRTNENRTRPDVVVRCGAVSERNFIVDPVAIAEVLSPSTMDYDRGQKLVFYKQIPTLRHVALIYQDRMSVEHFRRDDAGWTWEILARPDDELAFDALGFSISLARLYFAIEFAAPGQVRLGSAG